VKFLRQIRQDPCRDCCGGIRLWIGGSFDILDIEHSRMQRLILEKIEATKHMTWRCGFIRSRGTLGAYVSSADHAGGRYRFKLSEQRRQLPNVPHRFCSQFKVFCLSALVDGSV